jgi:hypothetical protein
MKKEKKLFFRRIKDLLDEDGNIPNYDSEGFVNWLLHHSDIPTHKKDDCARRYPIYLKTFIIPLEELDGGEVSQSKSRFRKRVSKQVKQFIDSKTSPSLNPNQEHQQVSLNVHVYQMEDISLY